MISFPGEGRRPGRRRLSVSVAAAAALLTGCAVEVPPPGGPVDTTPPRVLESVPAPDSAGVASDSPLSLRFSEKMTRKGVAGLLSFEPEAKLARERWDGRTLLVEIDGGLHPETTYVVTLRPGFRDNHNVAATTPYRFAFATSAAIDTGSIGGRVMFRREPTPNAVVRCFQLPRDSAFTPAAARPDRETATDESGAFRLDYLPASNRRFVVWAFEDRGGDGRFDAGREFGAAYVDTIVLTASSPVAREVDIWIVDPGEPGKIAGRVLNETGFDTVAVSVALFAANDTLRPSYYGKCTREGRYEFGSVQAGTYALAAFVDLAPDSVCGAYPCGPDSTDACAEPCAVLPDSLTLAPGDEIRVPGFRLGPANAESP